MRHKTRERSGSSRRKASRRGRSGSRRDRRSRSREGGARKALERRRNRSRSRSRTASKEKEIESSEKDRRKIDASEPVRAKVAPPADLPVLAFKEKIIDHLIENHILVVVGETGSGKTTQIPQYLADSERFAKLFSSASKPLRIAITQPRRVAAVAMAKRVSQERGTRLGGQVGYTIRFEDRSTPETTLRYMTDGCLLRECLNDPTLSGYQVVVLDEAHERSLHTDVLFALTKRAEAARAGQLRVLIMSATLNTGAFSDYFGCCPILEVPGRCFPVDMHYHPIAKGNRVEAAVNVVLNLHVREPDNAGHILVFLTGMEECEQAVALANKKLQELVDNGKEVGDCLIVPLYGMMQSDDQRNVFEEAPEGCRKLVFSTNIAETSITINKVGYVVDCGYCKQKNFNPKTGMESLMVTEISQVQATQRAGRAGRTQHGKCFRLFSEETFNRSFLKITIPEIVRSNLCSVTLQMKAMGIDDVINFDFMDPPDAVRLIKSVRTLFLLGALDADAGLTPLGREMSEFPLEPQFARSLIESGSTGCADDMVTLVSMLSAEGIWFRPSRQSADQVEAAEAAQSAFIDPMGDHTTLLNVYREYEAHGRDMGWCKENYLHMRALRQASDIRSQLLEQLEKAGVKLKPGQSKNKKYSDVLKALCAGFYMQSARICSAGGGWLSISDNLLIKAEGASAIHGTCAKWVLYTELVGNTAANIMMRTVTAIEYNWLEPFLPRLQQVDLKRLAGEPKVQKKQVAEKPAAESVTEKQNRILSAKERYLARKTDPRA